MKTQIGIKLADGKFYPILEDGAASRKRLVVTTVRDNQQSVQIDVYRGGGPMVHDADYIGSLVIEKISPAAKGGPDIRLDLELDGSGMLDAYAEDLASGQHQSLEVSLQSLEEEDKYEIPDFAFEEAETDTLPASAAVAVEAAPEGQSKELPAEQTASGTDSAAALAEGIAIGEAGAAAAAAAGGEAALAAHRGAEKDARAAEQKTAAVPPVMDRISTVETAALLSTDSTAEALEKEEKKEKNRKLIPRILLIIALAALVAVAVIWLLQRCGTQQAKPAENPAPVQEAPLVATTEPLPAAPAPAPEAAPAAVPEPAKTPAAPAPKKGGVWYKLHWGDTLWDLSYSFYQNPWLYPKIARANKIKNPDYIISGTRIWIPER